MRNGALFELAFENVVAKFLSLGKAQRYAAKHLLFTISFIRGKTLR